jgi:FxsC-like protein
VLYFFLSYARGDEDDLVRQFFSDLSLEVRVRAGLPKTEEVGFVDAQLKVGMRWSSQLVNAISTCRSFVALTSPRYFLSVPCGQEWQVFADRSERYEAQTGVDPAGLKPLVWVPPVPPHQLHPTVARLQYVSQALGETYQRSGIRQLLRLQRHQDAYREFLFELAGDLVEQAERHQIPPSTTYVDLEGVPSVFHHTPAGRHDPINGARAAPAAGALTVHFVIAAPTRDRADSVRTVIDYYGARPQDWAPYLPAAPNAIAEYALNLAADRSVHSRVAGISELGHLVEQATRRNQIVVLLLDPWLTALPESVRILTMYSRTQESEGRDPTTAVLIPGNQDDAETRQAWRPLSEACRRIFRGLADDDELYRSNIRSYESFVQELPATVEVAVNRTFGTGQVLRRAVGEVSRDRPTLDIP